jgi:tRNA (adenine22-N1)-methyltransferase
LELPNFFFYTQPNDNREKYTFSFAENGYVTEAERMVFEDGKYYPMMRVHYQAEKNEDADKAIKDMENSKEQKKSRYKVECLYGRHLLMEKNPILHQYLQKEHKVFETILDNLLKLQFQSDILRLIIFEAFLL